MPNYNNILDMIGEGIRESNPIYRQKMEQQRQEQARMAEITQQQLFQSQQNTANRATPTAYETRELGLREGERADLNAERVGRLKASGDLVEDEAATPSPAATGPADAATNGMGGAGGNGPQGALTPTAATASAAPTGGIGDSGGGPSAPPIWKNPFENILPQGPLTGAPGGAPAGNTSANTQQSRASSAQAGPLAQINQGSVTPSQTAAGQTGMDSGAQPSATGGMSPAQKMMAPNQPPPGSFEDYMKKQNLRWASPEEKSANIASVAREQASQELQLKRDRLSGWLKEHPEIANDKDTVDQLTLNNETGMKLPEPTLANMEGKVMSTAMAQAKAGDMAGYKRSMDVLTDIHTHQQNPPQVLMKTPSGQFYTARPGVTAGPGDVPVNQNPNIGSIVLATPNPQGGSDISKVNPSIGGAPVHVGPGTVTPAGMTQEAEAQAKEERTYQQSQANTLNEYRTAKLLATQPSPANDRILLMHFIGATKPDDIQKLRLNNNELALAEGARSKYGDLESIAQHWTSGQLLPADQKADFVHAMGMMALPRPKQSGTPMTKEAADIYKEVYTTKGKDGKDHTDVAGAKQAAQLHGWTF